MLLCCFIASFECLSGQNEERTVHDQFGQPESFNESKSIKMTKRQHAGLKNVESEYDFEESEESNVKKSKRMPTRKTPAKRKKKKKY